MTVLLALGVAVGGGLGALLRAEVTARVVAAGRPSAVGTTAVNLLGTAVLAAVAGAEDGVVLVVGAGFCGGLTTFSTWVLEAVPGTGWSTSAPTGPFRSIREGRFVRLLRPVAAVSALALVLATGVVVATLVGG